MDLSTFAYTELFALSGLALDIFGALFIARSLMVKRIAKIDRESSTFVGHNPALTKSFIEQTKEARVGGAALSLGFALQVLARLMEEQDVSGVIISMSVIAFSILVLWIIAGRFVKSSTHRLYRRLDLARLLESIKSYENGHPGQINDDKVNRWAKAVGLARSQGESNDDLLHRVKEKIHRSRPVKIREDS